MNDIEPRKLDEALDLIAASTTDEAKCARIQALIVGYDRCLLANDWTSANAAMDLLVKGGSVSTDEERGALFEEAERIVQRAYRKAAS